MAKKILLIDDEEDILRLVKLRLSNTGYEVVTAADGESALDLIVKEAPDLILLDLRLPGISGQEICKYLKSNDRFKRIPVILFTASIDLISERAEDYGAEDFLIKPFEAAELLSKIKKFI